MGEGSPIADPLQQPKPEETVGSATQIPASPKPEVKEEPQPAESRKRKLDHGAVDALRSSTYFKIRSIIKDLRPFFIEVINAPDFRESKAAHDIRKQMKTMIDLTRQLRDEASVAKPKKLSKEQHSAGIKEEKYQQGHAPQTQNGSIPSSSNSAPLHNNKIPVAADEKIPEVKEFAKKLEEGFQGTYVIGGSPVGWNYLVYLGSELTYYGETKAAFRSRQALKMIPNVDNV